LIDLRSGEIVFWTAETGIGELDLVCIDPLPAYVWYRDVAGFAEGISDEQVGRRLARAIQGRGAFRRFKDCLYQDYPHLVAAWHAFRAALAERRAVDWLLDNVLVDDAARALPGRAPQAESCPDRTTLPSDGRDHQVAPARRPPLPMTGP